MRNGIAKRKLCKYTNRSSYIFTKGIMTLSSQIEPNLYMELGDYGIRKVNVPRAQSEVYLSVVKDWASYPPAEKLTRFTKIHQEARDRQDGREAALTCALIAASAYEYAQGGINLYSALEQQLGKLEPKTRLDIRRSITQGCAYAIWCLSLEAEADREAVKDKAMVEANKADLIIKVSGMLALLR